MGSSAKPLASTPQAHPRTGAGGGNGASYGQCSARGLRGRLRGWPGAIWTYVSKRDGMGSIRRRWVATRGQLPPLESALRSLRAKYSGVTWPGQETGGTVAEARASTTGDFNGSYVGVTLNQATGNSAIQRAVLYDGVNDYTNVYTAALAGFVGSGDKTMIVFAKVSGAGVWTDGQNRRLFQLQSDTPSVMWLGKKSTNNILEVGLLGDTYKAFNVSTSTVAWFMFAAVWEGITGKAFLNGVQSGATQSGTGPWTGTLTATQNVLGAQNTTPISLWSGLIAYPTLLHGAATADELLKVAQLAQVA